MRLASAEASRARTQEAPRGSATQADEDAAMRSLAAARRAPGAEANAQKMRPVVVLGCLPCA